MKEQDNHYHADSFYGETKDSHKKMLLANMVETIQRNGKSLNAHLPFEIQHPDEYVNLKDGLSYVHFGETIKEMYTFPLYWENAPEQTFGQWTLKRGQTIWHFVPKNIDLTLDIGHLMLGSKTITEARDRIERVLYERGTQIKHVHIHENDLVHDWHWPIGRVITPTLFDQLTHQRTYIFERDEVITGESPPPESWEPR